MFWNNESFEYVRKVWEGFRGYFSHDEGELFLNHWNELIDHVSTSWNDKIIDVNHVCKLNMTHLIFLEEGTWIWLHLNHPFVDHDLREVSLSWFWSISETIELTLESPDHRLWRAWESWLEGLKHTCHLLKRLAWTPLHRNDLWASSLGEDLWPIVTQSLNDVLLDWDD